MSNDTAPERLFQLEYIMHVKRHDEPVSAPTQGGTLCSAVVVIALQPEPDGALTVPIESIDVAGNQLTDDELFKVWLALGDRIAKSPTADDGTRKFCTMIMQTFLEIVTPAEPGEQAPEGGPQ